MDQWRGAGGALGKGVIGEEMTEIFRIIIMLPVTLQSVSSWNVNNEMLLEI